MGTLSPDLNAEIQEREPQQKRRDEIDLAGHMNKRGRESYRYKKEKSQNHLAGQRFPFRFDNGQHLDVAAPVIFPVHPGDCMEVRELPEE